MALIELANVNGPRRGCVLGWESRETMGAEGEGVYAIAHYQTHSEDG
jgi:hypothetical protein